jgi:hypothetical protein
LSFSEVISGEHHDVYQIQKQFKILIERLIILDIRVDGLIINAVIVRNSDKFVLNMELNVILSSILKMDK